MPRVNGAISKPRMLDPERLRERVKPVYAKFKERSIDEADMPVIEYLIECIFKLMKKRLISGLITSRIG